MQPSPHQLSVSCARAVAERGPKASEALAQEIELLGPLADETTRELLQLLVEDAPGTFLHAQQVATIMQAVTVDPLDRRAILLHDLGKLCDPTAFGENSHVRRGPRPDASILRRHVVFGQQLATRHGLDERCLAAIAEHHGTLTIDATTRYPGPAPRSAFTAALMLCDCYEAVSAQGALTASRAKQLLRARVQAGQFNALDAPTLGAISIQVWRRVVLLGLVQA